MNVSEGFPNSWLCSFRPKTLEYGLIIDGCYLERLAEAVETDGVAASINPRMLGVTNTPGEKALCIVHVWILELGDVEGNARVMLRDDFVFIAWIFGIQDDVEQF